jgi:dsDNA-binding SOS-regulon protein
MRGLYANMVKVLVPFALEKMSKTTTTEISIDVYDKLHSVADRIAQIVHKKTISLNQALKIMFATQSLDQILQELTQEEKKWQ